MSKQRSILLPKTATMSNEFCVEISSFRQRRTLLRHCCPNRRHCRSNRQQSCLLLRQCCFDIVASVDRVLQSFGQTRTLRLQSRAKRAQSLETGVGLDNAYPVNHCDARCVFSWETVRRGRRQFILSPGTAGN